jgi:hypothetical protein
MLLDRSAVVLSHSSGEATRIEVVNTLNLNDHGSRWVSTSVFGNVYSFLSENILWWGSVSGTDIGISGVRVRSSPHHARRFSSTPFSCLAHSPLRATQRKIPPEFRPNLAVIIGFGFDPQTGHYIVELYSYSSSSSSVVRDTLTLLLH